MATTNMEENTISFSERDVELRLKLGLWGRRYTNLEIHKINNKHLRVQFENRNTKTSRVVVTWARSQESATTIAKRGFEIEREGKTFSVSSPNPCLTTTTHKNQAKDEKEDERDKNNEMKEQKDSHDDSNIVTAFLCAVDVGKSVPVSRSRDRGIDSSLERPCDSDSIHICRKSLAELSDAFGNVVKTTSMQNEKQHSKDIIEGDYDHTYVIYEPTQILPLYMVRFRLEPKEDSKVAMICMNCEIEHAVMHCPQCDAKLCSECDTKHHNQKLLRGHKRYRIARDGMTLSMEEDKSSNGGFSSLTIRSMCPKHPKQSVQFFDPILHVPVCIHCKMTGSHARGEARDHTLISIKDVYEKTLKQVNQPTDELKRWEAAARMTASVCHQQKKTIQSNAANLQQRLEREYLRAKRRIEEAEEKRLGIVLGEELEALRQWQELNRVRMYLRSVRSQLSAVEFIDAASRASAMMSRMLKRFRSEGSKSGIVVRENEEKLRLIGGKWRVLGASSLKNEKDFDDDDDDDDVDHNRNTQERNEKEEVEDEDENYILKPALAVPDVCRNARHVARNLKEGFVLKQNSECSCLGLWRYYVLRNTERSCKRRFHSKCYLRKARIMLNEDKVVVKFPGDLLVKKNNQDVETKKNENTTKEQEQLWGSALEEMVNNVVIYS